MFSLVVQSLCFFAPTVRLDNGQKVSLHGTGPPVLFSGGLFGYMPHQLYSSLFKLMKRDVTFAVLEGVSPVTTETVDLVTKALAVDEIALFTHSSIDTDLLNSKKIKTAVLCDPVVMPEISLLKGGLAPPETDCEFPTIVLKAEKAYDVDTPGIPDMISPQLDMVNATIFPGVGHADILDDTWAEIGKATIPWMKGVENPPVPFNTWSFRSKNQASEFRKAYREEVANAALAHILKDMEVKQEEEDVEVVVIDQIIQ